MFITNKIQLLLLYEFNPRMDHTTILSRALTLRRFKLDCVKKIIKTQNKNIYLYMHW